ncbi:unnamed protein product [Amoebophrya sp. A120]|nr:unnamed protein product [Amoebophrya sp. A120]|eukprot:GSA120T00000723001.1
MGMSDEAWVDQFLKLSRNVLYRIFGAQIPGSPSGLGADGLVAVGDKYGDVLRPFFDNLNTVETKKRPHAHVTAANKDPDSFVHAQKFNPFYELAHSAYARFAFLRAFKNFAIAKHFHEPETATAAGDTGVKADAGELFLVRDARQALLDSYCAKLSQRLEEFDQEFQREVGASVWNPKLRTTHAELENPPIESLPPTAQQPLGFIANTPFKEELLKEVFQLSSLDRNTERPVAWPTLDTITAKVDSNYLPSDQLAVYVDTKTTLLEWHTAHLEQNIRLLRDVVFNKFKELGHPLSKKLSMLQLSEDQSNGRLGKSKIVIEEESQVEPTPVSSALSLDARQATPSSLLDLDPASSRPRVTAASRDIVARVDDMTSPYNSRTEQISSINIDGTGTTTASLAAGSAARAHSPSGVVQKLHQPAGENVAAFPSVSGASSPGAVGSPPPPTAQLCIQYPDTGLLLAAWHEHPGFATGGLAVVFLLLVFVVCRCVDRRFLHFALIWPRGPGRQADEEPSSPRRHMNKLLNERAKDVPGRGPPLCEGNKDEATPSLTRTTRTKKGKNKQGQKNQQTASQYGTLRQVLAGEDNTPQLSSPDCSRKKQLNSAPTSKQHDQGGRGIAQLHKSAAAGAPSGIKMSSSGNSTNTVPPLAPPTPSASESASEDSRFSPVVEVHRGRKYDPESLERLVVDTSAAVLSTNTNISDPTASSSGSENNKASPSMSEKISKKNKKKKKNNKNSKTVMSMSATGTGTGVEMSPPPGPDRV